jgi:hypothetical protein
MNKNLNEHEVRYVREWVRWHIAARKTKPSSKSRGADTISKERKRELRTFAETFLRAK